MNLIDEQITHKVFGKGNIVDHNDSIITVDFDEDIKKFVYPDAFRKFIKLNNPDLAKSLEKVLVKREKEEAILEQQREEEREKRAIEQQLRARIKNNKIHESSQIVFWLDEEEKQTVLADWTTSTGEVQSGKNKGQPNKAARLSPNSAAVLTVRDDDQPETERRIFGLYMVNERFEGNQAEDGMVPAHANFRIELTEEETDKMLFWNYYINKTYPHRTAWNSGRYRYFDNIWTAQILKDIIALRTDEAQIEFAQNFLEYFCKVNALDIDDIPEPDGALKQENPA